MRLLLDEHFPSRLAERLRDRGHDVVAVQDLGDLRSAPDEDLLRWAAEHGRAVVTEDAADFMRLHQDWLVGGESHCGLVLTSSRRFTRGARGTGRLISALDQLLCSPRGPASHPGWVVWLDAGSADRPQPDRP